MLILKDLRLAIITSGGSRIFPGGGGANSQKCYYFSIFCRKLHENERIWTPGGGARPWRPLGSANDNTIQIQENHGGCKNVCWRKTSQTEGFDVFKNTFTGMCNGKNRNGKISDVYRRFWNSWNRETTRLHTDRELFSNDLLDRCQSGMCFSTGCGDV